MVMQNIGAWVTIILCKGSKSYAHHLFPLVTRGPLWLPLSKYPIPLNQHWTVIDIFGYSFWQWTVCEYGSHKPIMLNSNIRTIASIRDKTVALQLMSQMTHNHWYFGVLGILALSHCFYIKKIHFYTNVQWCMWKDNFYRLPKMY